MSWQVNTWLDTPLACRVAGQGATIWRGAPIVHDRRVQLYVRHSSHPNMQAVVFARLSLPLFVLKHLPFRHYIYVHVMNHAPVSGKYLCGLKPLIFSEISRHIDDLILVLHTTAYYLLWNREYDVRFNMPPIRERRSRRKVFRIAFFRATSHPPANGLDLRVRQTRVIAEFVRLRISIPGRHDPLHNFFTD